jgi:hypothetical protein
MTDWINRETTERIRADRRRGVSLRKLGEMYGYKKDKIHHVVMGVPVAGAAAKKEKIARVREIMETWEIVLPSGERKIGLSRPAAAMIYDLEVLARDHPEHAGLLDDLRSGKRKIRTTHREFIGAERNLSRFPPIVLSV